MIANNTTITELNLGWNRLREKGSEALAKGMEANISLRILNISWNGIGANGGAAWGQIMANNTSVKVGIISLWTAPPFPSLLFPPKRNELSPLLLPRLLPIFKVLDMSNNRIMGAAWTSIIESIKSNDTLETLILTGNYLNPEEAVVLQEAKAENSTMV